MEILKSHLHKTIFNVVWREVHDRKIALVMLQVPFMAQLLNQTTFTNKCQTNFRLINIPNLDFFLRYAIITLTPIK